MTLQSSTTHVPLLLWSNVKPILGPWRRRKQIETDTDLWIPTILQDQLAWQLLLDSNAATLEFSWVKMSPFSALCHLGPKTSLKGNLQPTRPNRSCGYGHRRRSGAPWSHPMCKTFVKWDFFFSVSESVRRTDSTELSRPLSAAGVCATEEETRQIHKKWSEKWQVLWSETTGLYIVISTVATPQPLQGKSGQTPWEIWWVLL